jgi:chemotaxis family two-component system response regulator Rcp1
MYMTPFENPPEILLVEDSPTDSSIMVRALAQNPRRKHVTTLADGEQAMTHLRAKTEARPDLVLLDLNLPKKDGWQVLAECKNDPFLKAIPIVVFTTSQLLRDVRRCYELGANSVVTKPFDLLTFLQAVQGIEDFWLGIAELKRSH